MKFNASLVPSPVNPIQFLKINTKFKILLNSPNEMCI